MAPRGPSIATAIRCGWPAATLHSQSASRARLAPSWSTDRSRSRRRSRSSPQTWCCCEPPSRPTNHASSMACSSCSGGRAVGTTRPIALSPRSQGLLSVGRSRGRYSARYGRSQRNFLQDVHHGTLARVQVPRRGSKHRAPMVLPARSPATISVIAAYLDGTGHLLLVVTTIIHLARHGWGGAWVRIPRKSWFLSTLLLEGLCVLTAQ